jgi:hypothetical protein
LGQTQIVPSLLALEAMADHREAYLNAHGLSALVPGAPVDCPLDVPAEAGSHPAWSH